MEEAKLILLLSFFLSLVTFAYSAHQDFLDCTAKYNLSSNTITIYSPRNSNFTTILDSYARNERYDRPSTPKPTLIATPTEEGHVSTIVQCANSSNLHLRIRSGGHDFEGTSYASSYDNDEFIILDMFNLRSISIDAANSTAWVGAGATLGELYYEIWTKNSTFLSFPGGDCPSVAIGGYGSMMRRFGLATDYVIDAEIVVANGSVLNRTSMGPDLFWAIRGGGGASFGVVLSYELQLVAMPWLVTVFKVDRYSDFDNATGILYEYQTIAPAINNDLFIRAVVQPENSTRIRTTYTGMFLGEKVDLNETISEGFPSLGLKESDYKQMNWTDSVLYWANLENSTTEALLNRSSDVVFFKGKSDYVKTAISVSDWTSIFEVMMANGEVRMELTPYGGIMNTYSESGTPFPYRTGNLFKILYFVEWEDTSKEAENKCMTQIRNVYNNMTDHVTSNPRATYFNFRDLDIGTNNGMDNYTLGEVYGRRYFNQNFDRLVEIKTVVDPGNFFRNEQSIPTNRTK